MKKKVTQAEREMRPAVGIVHRLPAFNILDGNDPDFDVIDYYEKHVKDSPDDYKVEFIRFEYVRRNMQYCNEWLYLEDREKIITNDDGSTETIYYPSYYGMAKGIAENWEIKYVSTPRKPLPRYYIHSVKRDKQHELADRLDELVDRAQKSKSNDEITAFEEEYYSIQQWDGGVWKGKKLPDYYDYENPDYRRDNATVVKLDFEKLKKRQAQNVCIGSGRWVAVLINLDAGQEEIIKILKQKKLLPKAKKIKFRPDGHLIRIRVFDLKRAKWTYEEIANELSINERDVKRYAKQAVEYINGKYRRIR